MTSNRHTPGAGSSEEGVSRDGKCKRSCLGTCAALAGILISLFWILNFSLGVFEIPDNLPIVGNLDEAFFTMLFLGCLSYLGVNIPFIRNIK